MVGKLFLYKNFHIAKEENATKTYEGLRKDYRSLKAVLTSLDVNLTDIDEIKE